MSVEKISRKNDFSVVTETQIYELFANLLYQLSKTEDHTINIDTIKFDQNVLKEVVGRLDVKKNRTTVFERYARTMYIKVGAPDTNTSSTKVEFNITRNDSMFIHMTLVIPPNFSNNVSIKPVSIAISNATRSLIPEIDVKFIEVTRESSHGVKEYYYVIDLKVDGFTLAGTQTVEVTNELANTTVFDNITFDDNVETITTNVIKTTKLLTPPVIAFDDIPDRDKLIRSKTVDNYEIISKTDYQALEAAGTVDPKTVYSIPEDYQLPNPDEDKILTMKISGSGTVDLTKILKSYSKIKFNGDIVESIPSNTVGTVEIFDAVALDTYNSTSGLKYAQGLKEFYGEIDTVNTTSTSFMFADLSELTYLNISGLKGEVIETVVSMFSKAPLIEYLDLSTLKLSNITDFTNFISLSNGDIKSKIVDINMNGVTTPLTDTQTFVGSFVDLPLLTNVYMSLCDTNTINMFCTGINGARTTTADTKIKVHVDSATLVDGLTFSNIEFIY